MSKNVPTGKHEPVGFNPPKNIETISEESPERVTIMSSPEEVERKSTKPSKSKNQKSAPQAATAPDPNVYEITFEPKVLLTRTDKIKKKFKNLVPNKSKKISNDVFNIQDLYDNAVVNTELHAKPIADDIPRYNDSDMTSEPTPKPKAKVEIKKKLKKFARSIKRKLSRKTTKASDSIDINVKGKINKESLRDIGL